MYTVRDEEKAVIGKTVDARTSCCDNTTQPKQSLFHLDPIESIEDVLFGRCEVGCFISKDFDRVNCGSLCDSRQQACGCRCRSSPFTSDVYVCWRSIVHRVGRHNTGLAILRC